MFKRLANIVGKMKDTFLGALWAGAGHVNLDVPPDDMDLDSYLQNVVQADLSDLALEEVPVMVDQSATDDEMNELWVDPAAVEGLVRDDNGVVQVVPTPAGNQNNVFVEASVTEEPCCDLPEEEDLQEVEEARLIQEIPSLVCDAPVVAEAFGVENQQDGDSAVTLEDIEIGQRVRVCLTALSPEIITKWTVRRKRMTVKRHRRREPTEEEEVRLQREDLFKGEPEEIARLKMAAVMDLCRLQLVSIPDCDLHKYRKRQRLDDRALVEEAARDEMIVVTTQIPKHVIERYTKKAEDAGMPELTKWNDIPPNTSSDRDPPTLPRMKDSRIIVQLAPWTPRSGECLRVSGSTEKRLKKPSDDAMPKLENWMEVPITSDDNIPTLEIMQELVPTVKFKTPEKLRIQSLSQPGSSRQSGNRSDAQHINGDYSHNLLRLVTQPRKSIRKNRPVPRKPFRPLAVNGTAEKCPRTEQRTVNSPVVEVSRSACVPAPGTSYKSLTFVSIDDYWDVVDSGDFQTRLDCMQPNKIWSEPVQSLLTSDVWSNIHSPRIPKSEAEHFERKSSDFKPKKPTRRCARVIPFKKAVQRSNPSKNREHVEVHWTKRGDIQRATERNTNTQARIVIRNSPIHGRGLFTLDPIPRGAVITEYIGEVIRSSVCNVREQKYLKEGKLCYFFAIKDTDLVIDATIKGTPARYINHSCDPNCKTKEIGTKGRERIIIRAKRKIAANTELTYDYMFEPSEDQLPCNCSANKCKKYI